MLIFAQCFASIKNITLLFPFSSKSPKATNQNKPTKQARQWAGEGSIKEATQLNYSTTDGSEESLVVSSDHVMLWQCHNVITWSSRVHQLQRVVWLVTLNHWIMWSRVCHHHLAGVGGYCHSSKDWQVVKPSHMIQWSQYWTRWLIISLVSLSYNMM